MGFAQACEIVEGDRVMFGGEFRMVVHVKREGKDWPYFYLGGTGWVSWQQCGRYPDGRDQPRLFEDVKQPGLF